MSEEKDTVDEINTDDLFDDGDEATQPAEPVEPVVEEKPKPKRKRKPKPKTEAGGGEQIDNAIAIRIIDWQCVCGNRNTHELARCGKCYAPRYTTA